MIKIEKTEVLGWKAAIRGMRNPMNSWEKSDSVPTTDEEGKILEIGENDNDLMTRLARKGSVHAKYRRMIHVQADVTAPLYWWKEYDTYKVGTVANSCSTMHKIAEKEFTIDDFSFEHLIGDDSSDDSFDRYEPGECHSYECYPTYVASDIIECLNWARKKYLETHDKKYWWQLIQLLPSSYNQKRTIDLSYEVLSQMYYYRLHHKLDEWREFCKWIEGLPLSLDIIHPEDITLNGEA